MPVLCLVGMWDGEGSPAPQEPVDEFVKTEVEAHGDACTVPGAEFDEFRALSRAVWWDTPNHSP